ncbi:MAG TPA: FAD:protein FMN transferase [Opitutaceae bacterium]
MTRRWIIAWLALGSLVTGVRAAATGDTPALQRFAFTEPHMGTLFQIVLFAPEASAAQAAASAAFARIAELNRLFSDYDPDSEVSRLSRAPVGTPVKISPELAELLQRSQTVARQSEGAFDVTLGPMVRQWREARKTGLLPDPTAREEARQATGHRYLQLDPVTSTVVLARAGMRIDLGGIAKGYAADEALAVMKRRGLPRAMVAASGDLALGDPPPGKSGWTVEIAPFGRASDIPLTLVVANAGISTSGDTEQAVEIGGVRYSHIVDPATGLGLTKPVAVSVIARDATTSDALATACSVADGLVIERLIAAQTDAVRILHHQPRSDGSVERTLYGRDPAGLVSRL